MTASTRARPCRSVASDERGGVTAETAVVLPALVLVLGAAVWCVSVLAAQVRCADAAREGARAVARGEQPALVRDLVLDAAPEGARLTITHASGQVRVVVSAQVRPPGPVLSRIGGIDVSSTAVTLDEATPSEALP